MTSSENNDFDSPWKEILEAYLPEFLAFFFPQIHAEIDWNYPPVFLDKELQQVVRDANLGRRLADKLVQVRHRDGNVTWVLIHIEIQGQEEAGFPERMFVYAYRLYDRYRRPVVSLAVLGDERASWRPQQFTLGLWGCTTQFTFPVVKLLDYRPRWTELEASRNPFATVVLVHLTAQDTRKDALQRAQAKLHLTRRLYDMGYERMDIIRLFHFIDWLLYLPDDLAQTFWQEVQQWEEARRMPYITSVERMGIQKGRAEGRAEGLLAGITLALELKFGTDGLQLVPEIQSITDLAVIEAVHAAIKQAQTLDEVRQVYAPPDM